MYLGVVYNGGRDALFDAVSLEDTESLGQAKALLGAPEKGLKKGMRVSNLIWEKY